MEEIAHSRLHVINEFALKIIGIILMTLDHIGVFMVMNNIEPVGTIFRCIGRIAFPLFILMLVEGARHTRSFSKYILRLGIVAAAISLAEALIYYFIDQGIQIAYSPFNDLVLLALILYLIKRKDKFSWFVILPISVIGLSFAVEIFENLNNSTVLWFPFYLRSGYSLYGLLLALGLWFALPLSRKILGISDSTKNLEGTAYHRSCLNIVMGFIVFLVVLAMFILEFSTGMQFYTNGKASVTWGFVSIIIILLYNGTRGYNKPWFKYGCYLYFPIHLVIIFTIFTLILG